MHPTGVCTDNVPPVLIPPLPPLTTIVGNNGCRDIDTLAPRTELAIDKTDGDDVAIPGTEITYTITVRNNGPSNVVGAAVQDDLTNIFPTGATWTCVAAPSGTLTFLGDYVEGEILPGPQTSAGYWARSRSRSVRTASMSTPPASAAIRWRRSASTAPPARSPSWRPTSTAWAGSTA